MWERFKDWILSDNFAWFMLGWQICEFLTKPTLWNAALVAFWVWVLTSDL